MATNSKPPEHTTVLSHVSSSYILFPELAEAIRDAPTDEAIEAFKGLAKIVVMAHQARRMKTGNIPNDIHVDCLFRKIEAEFRAFQRLTFWGTDDVGGHDDVRASTTRSSSSTNGGSSERAATAEKTATKRVAAMQQTTALETTEPEATGLETAGPESDVCAHICYRALMLQRRSRSSTTTSKGWWGMQKRSYCGKMAQRSTRRNTGWSVACSRLWMPMPRHAPNGGDIWKNNQSMSQRRMQRSDTSGICDASTKTAHPFVSLACFDAAGVSVVLREYISLGATAAGIWMHMWQSHGIQRGQPLADDDYHVQVALEKIEESFGDRISDWQDAAPLHVRHVLAEHCFEGDFLFLTNHVFPAVIAPSGSGIHEDSFAGEIHKFIVRAATSVHVDPQGRIRRLIQQCGWYPEETHPNGNHGQPQLARPFVSFRNINSQEQ
ncbi:hypothetical protein EJ02DRAFT_493037 [Clathrospora elynae]|uniref:Uncharacterized protein n=1 Tax=Clathrospora elynae TaxID=706981 RepID=A0A6A5SLU4_9PLEO|nr:hypothetical protein EJ02DRAFT_493037 [Clathrospora elynae]